MVEEEEGQQFVRGGGWIDGRMEGEEEEEEERRRFCRPVRAGPHHTTAAIARGGFS